MTSNEEVRGHLRAALEAAADEAQTALSKTYEQIDTQALLQSKELGPAILILQELHAECDGIEGVQFHFYDHRRVVSVELKDDLATTNLSLRFDTERNAFELKLLEHYKFAGAGGYDRTDYFEDASGAITVIVTRIGKHIGEQQARLERQRKHKI